jgi:hypothetical protein
MIRCEWNKCLVWINFWWCEQNLHGVNFFGCIPHGVKQAVFGVNKVSFFGSFCFTPYGVNWMDVFPWCLLFFVFADRTLRHAVGGGGMIILSLFLIGLRNMVFPRVPEGAKCIIIWTHPTLLPLRHVYRWEREREILHPYHFRLVVCKGESDQGGSIRRRRYTRITDIGPGV